MLNFLQQAAVGVLRERVMLGSCANSRAGFLLWRCSLVERMLHTPYDKIANGVGRLHLPLSSWLYTTTAWLSAENAIS